jgi:uncharacterized protein
MESCVIITYGSLLLAVVLPWFGLGQSLKARPWYFLFVISILAAFSCSFINLQAVLYIALFGFICYRYQYTENTLWALLVLALALPLFFHINILGFNNYRFLDHVRITASAVPYSLYFNLDKTLICIFLLGFSSFRLSKDEIKNTGKQFIVCFPVLALLLLGACLLSGYVFFEPKLPGITPIWTLVNLFFVCTSEELLFRRIIQKELTKNLNMKNGNYLAILTGAILFGLAHFAGGLPYVVLATVCGSFYGYIYDKTKEVRSSIVLHFSINMLHFLLFTYPAVQK